MRWYGTKRASKLSSMNRSKILVFDVETTGTKYSFDEILQITILDGYGNKRFSSYIKPVRHKTWPIARRINGITYSMVENAPTFKEVEKEIQNIFNECQIVVGYNIAFDIHFVEAAGIVVEGARFDVMIEFAKFRADIEHSIYRNCKLVECAEYFGFSFDPHDSFSDASATLRCFDSLISDKRFTMYKLTERKQLKHSPPEPKKKTRFTIAIRKKGFFQSILEGIFLCICGLGAIIYMSGIAPKDTDSVKQLLLYVRDSCNNPWITISVIAIVLGLMIVLFRIIQQMIMMPKRIVVCFQRIFKRVRDHIN